MICAIHTVFQLPVYLGVYLSTGTRFAANFIISLPHVDNLLIPFVAKSFPSILMLHVPINPCFWYANNDTVSLWDYIALVTYDWINMENVIISQMILTQETEVLVRNLSQSHSHMEWPGNEQGPSQWETCNQRPDAWHCIIYSSGSYLFIASLEGNSHFLRWLWKMYTAQIYFAKPVTVNLPQDLVT